MANWYLRLSGDDQNGGGYDGDTYPGGSNLSNQDFAALSMTDLASTTATSIITSATGGFTSSMIGNAIRIKSGTNFTPGFYWITAVTDTNTATVHADPTNGSNASGGTARVGGAWGSFHPCCDSDAGTIKRLDGLDCPFGPGDTFWIEGSGSDAPSDIDYPQISGSTATLYGFSFAGPMLWKALPGTGRPYFQTDGFWFIGSLRMEGLQFHPGGSTSNLYMINTRSLDLYNCVIDNRGVAPNQIAINGGTSFVDCTWKGGGGGVAVQGDFGVSFQGCNFIDWGTGEINANQASLVGCVLKDMTIDINSTAIQYHTLCMEQNTLDNTVITCRRGQMAITNNVIANVAGTAISTDDTGYELRPHACNNGWYNVGTKFNSNIDSSVVGDNDVDCSSDPFTDQANGDYSPNSVADGGELLKGAGFPSGYNIDIGAVQSSSSGGLFNCLNEGLIV